MITWIFKWDETFVIYRRQGVLIITHEYLIILGFFKKNKLVASTSCLRDTEGRPSLPRR